MNPYASFLDGRDPLAVIAETAKKLNDLAARLGEEGLKRSVVPGKWSAREIICHLADCELAFGFRLRQALSEDNHVVQPFDQDKWAKSYSNYDSKQALALFSSAREWNLALIRSLPQQTFSKPLRHPERGEMVYQTLVDTMAGHDTNHLRQLETIAAQRPAR